jgi:hypothetical protein
MPDALPRPDRLDADDRALVARCADGDLNALQSLFHRHAGTVWGCAEVVARHPGAPHAEELASRAFIAVWDDAKAVLAGARSVEAALLVAVSRLGLGRPAFG